MRERPPAAPPPTPARIGCGRGGDLSGTRITYSALDDHGNAYLGALGDWSDSDDQLASRLEFTPALDPAATRLDIRLTANRSRAVIAVPLDWSPA